ATKGAKVQRLTERTRGERGKRVHRLPKEGQHRWILTIEQRPLRVRIPGGWAIGMYGLEQLTPARVESFIEHLYQTTKVVGLAAHKELLGQLGIVIATVLLHEQAQRGTAGEQHFGGALLNSESLGQLAAGGAGVARQPGEHIQFMGYS